MGSSLPGTNVQCPLSTTPVGLLPWKCRRLTGRQSDHHKWLASRKSWIVEESETLSADTNPETLRHWFPGGERYRKRNRSTMFLERTRESSSDEHWHCFKGNVGETSESGVHNYGLFRARRYHLELNRSERNWMNCFSPQGSVGAWSRIYIYIMFFTPNQCWLMKSELKALKGLAHAALISALVL